MRVVLNKLQATAKSLGENAARTMDEAAKTMEASSTKALKGFKLENECTKAGATLRSFLADPEHPESALNAIPKAVLQKCRGLAVFTVYKAGFVWYVYS